jgi:hypothetical protein
VNKFVKAGINKIKVNVDKLELNGNLRLKLREMKQSKTEKIV